MKTIFAYLPENQFLPFKKWFTRITLATCRWIMACFLYVSVRLKDACKLYCRASASSAFYLLKDKVVDGTKCGPDTFDMCVNGICQVKTRCSSQHCAVQSYLQVFLVEEEIKTCLGSWFHSGRFDFFVFVVLIHLGEGGGGMGYFKFWGMFVPWDLC